MVLAFLATYISDHVHEQENVSVGHLQRQDIDFLGTPTERKDLKSTCCGVVRKSRTTAETHVATRMVNMSCQVELLVW